MAEQVLLPGAALAVQPGRQPFPEPPGQALPVAVPAAQHRQLYQPACHLSGRAAPAVAVQRISPPPSLPWSLSQLRRRPEAIAPPAQPSSQPVFPYRPRPRPPVFSVPGPQMRQLQRLAEAPRVKFPFAP
ncbi:hypothetical protein JT06_09615 [Desulfobulbus sp. Tol-SR]|nr:hypothetical protein JT06_09615 [Desulfobulbus sp. Tol-SR]